MPIIIWAVIGVVLLLALAIWGVAKFTNTSKAPLSGDFAGSNSSAQTPKITPPPPNADSKTKLQAAQQYVDQKDYPMAEDIYRQVLRDEPRNVDALPGLATVLYREDKVAEAAATLDRIPK